VRGGVQGKQFLPRLVSLKGNLRDAIGISSRAQQSIPVVAGPQNFEILRFVQNDTSIACLSNLRERR